MFITSIGNGSGEGTRQEKIVKTCRMHGRIGILIGFTNWVDTEESSVSWRLCLFWTSSPSFHRCEHSRDGVFLRGIILEFVIRVATVVLEIVEIAHVGW